MRLLCVILNSVSCCFLVQILIPKYNTDIGIYRVWYSLTLTPTFSYNALDLLNDNQTEYFGKENKIHFEKKQKKNVRGTL